MNRLKDMTHGKELSAASQLLQVLWLFWFEMGGHRATPNKINLCRQHFTGHRTAGLPDCVWHGKA